MKSSNILHGTLLFSQHEIPLVAAYHGLRNEHNDWV